jgi:hypothetical protein
VTFLITSFRKATLFFYFECWIGEEKSFIREETEETLGNFELPEAEISPHPLGESTKKLSE